MSTPLGGQTSEPLRGRTALITGGSQGLGLEIARGYLRSGADGVCICGRDGAALESAASELRGVAREGQRVMAELADVSRPGDVERLVSAALGEFGAVTILVNNAGVYGPKGSIDQVDWADWVGAFEINVFGSMLTARALLGHFRERSYGKIVQLSGGGATAPLIGLSAYAASKAAVVRFAETLALELRDHQVDVNSIAPGALNTRMLDEILAAGPRSVGQAYYNRAVEQQRSGGAPLGGAADLAVFLASAASDGITGKLISAVWDPWREFAARRADLDSDVYTLRRIVPSDRGLGWGDVD